MPGLALPALPEAVLDTCLPVALGKAELSTLEGWNSVYTGATIFCKSFLFSVLLVIYLSPGAV